MGNEKKIRWYGPKQIGIMIFTGLCFLFAASMLGGNNNTVFPMMAEMRGWDVNILNIVSGVGAMLEAIGVLVFSKMIKKIGPRIAIGVSLIITAALMIVFGNTTNVMVMVVAILVVGLVGAIYDKAGSMILTANWWPTKKGVVLGFSTIGVCCMNLVYVPLMPKLIGGLGLNKAFAVIALLFVVLGLICFAFVRSTPEEAGEYPDGDPAFAEGRKAAEIGRLMKEYKSPFTLGKLLTNKNVIFLSISSFLAYMCAMGFIASTIPNLIALGYTPQFGTAIFAVGGIVSFPGSAIFGAIDQKIGTKKAWTLFLICMTIGFICTLGMGKAAVLAWLAGIIVFAANASLCNLLPSYVATMFGRWDYAAAYTVIGTIFTLGAGVGIMMTGFFHVPMKLYAFLLVAMIIALIFSLLVDSTFIGKKDEI